MKRTYFYIVKYKIKKIKKKTGKDVHEITGFEMRSIRFLIDAQLQRGKNENG